MNDQDKRAVEQMVMTGMSLEALYSCFPKFPKEVIEEIYNAGKSVDTAEEKTLFSVNCS